MLYLLDALSIYGRQKNEPEMTEFWNHEIREIHENRNEAMLAVLSCILCISWFSFLETQLSSKGGTTLRLSSPTTEFVTTNTRSSKAAAQKAKEFGQRNVFFAGFLCFTYSTLFRSMEGKKMNPR